ncbi:hypothetical protein ACFQIA_04055 [Halalkalicoccus sp. GCM10025704]
MGRRLGLGLVVLGLFLATAYVVEAFIAVVVFAVFLYYSVRPIHRFLRRFGLLGAFGRRSRSCSSGSRSWCCSATPPRSSSSRSSRSSRSTTSRTS